MSISRSTVAVLALAMMSGTALAQTPNTNTSTSSQMTTTSSSTPTENQTAGQLSIVKQLNGLYVYNDANENLGSINDFLVDSGGRIHKVIIGVGGFLGIGESNVAVNFDQLKWVNEPVRTSANTAPAAPAGSTMQPAGTTVGTTATTTTTTTTTPVAASRLPDHAVLSATKDQLKAMPQFKYAK